MAESDEAFVFVGFQNDRVHKACSNYVEGVAEIVQGLTEYIAGHPALQQRGIFLIYPTDDHTRFTDPKDWYTSLGFEPLSKEGKPHRIRKELKDGRKVDGLYYDKTIRKNVGCRVSDPGHRLEKIVERHHNSLVLRPGLHDPHNPPISLEHAVGKSIILNATVEEVLHRYHKGGLRNVYPPILCQEVKGLRTIHLAGAHYLDVLRVAAVLLSNGPEINGPEIKVIFHDAFVGDGLKADHRKADSLHNKLNETYPTQFIFQAATKVVTKAERFDAAVNRALARIA